MLGTGVCNGVPLDVLDVALRGGRFVLRMRPRLCGDLIGPVTIFGTDGWGVFQTATELRELDVNPRTLVSLNLWIDSLEPAPEKLVQD